MFFFYVWSFYHAILLAHVYAYTHIRRTRPERAHVRRRRMAARASGDTMYEQDHVFITVRAGGAGLCRRGARRS
jgi:hypothetical protein